MPFPPFREERDYSSNISKPWESFAWLLHLFFFQPMNLYMWVAVVQIIPQTLRDKYSQRKTIYMHTSLYALPWRLELQLKPHNLPWPSLGFFLFCFVKAVCPVSMNPILTATQDLPLSSVLAMRKAALSDWRLRFLSSNSTSRGLDESWQKGDQEQRGKLKLLTQLFCSLSSQMVMFTDLVVQFLLCQ